MSRFATDIEGLRSSGNLRSIPSEGGSDFIDLTSNDYLGLALRTDLQEEFLSTVDVSQPLLTSSASRLLAIRQKAYSSLESYLEDLYGRPTLLFNSGYHANTGIVSALADKRTLIVADRLVHASIIDGIMLSKARWTRFRHNDMDHLAQIIEHEGADYETIMVVVESVYSMDGDRPDLRALADLRRRHRNMLLYVDEAHAFGVEGPAGLGLMQADGLRDAADVVVVTLGKAAASQGAFAVVSDELRTYLVNHARSLIFSTALPPISAMWSEFVVRRMTGMDAEREHLRRLAARMACGLAEEVGNEVTASHIMPVIVGDAAKSVRLSQAMAEEGVKVLPIRTPTVPPGTERLRMSLSAALTAADIDHAVKALKSSLANL